MDIPSFLATYGGPGGLAAAAVWWTVQSRKFDSERRAELREDIDREQNENGELRARLEDKRVRLAAFEENAEKDRAEIRRLRAKAENLEQKVRELQADESEKL